MNKLFIIVFAAVIIAVAAIYIKRGSLPEIANAPAGEEENKTGEQVLSGVEGEAALMPEIPEETVIQYTDDGYASRSIRIKVGTKLTFVNESSGAMWPASAAHPTHLILPEFDARAGIQPGGSYSFIFERAGNWKFHDHLKPAHNGEIVVE